MQKFSEPKVTKHNGFTQERAESVLAWLADGKFLTQWCRDHKIPPSTVYQWKEDHPDFAVCFVRARDFGDEISEEEALEIADTKDFSIESETEATTKDGLVTTVRKADNVARSRLRAETRLKVVARRKGAMIRHTLTGDKNAPIMVQKDLPDLTPEQVLEIARMKDD